MSLNIRMRWSRKKTIQAKFLENLGNWEMGLQWKSKKVNDCEKMEAKLEHRLRILKITGNVNDHYRC